MKLKLKLEEEEQEVKTCNVVDYNGENKIQREEMRRCRCYERQRYET